MDVSGPAEVEAVRAFLAAKYKIPIRDISIRELAHFMKHSPDHPPLLAAIKAALEMESENTD